MSPGASHLIYCAWSCYAWAVRLRALVVWLCVDCGDRTALRSGTPTNTDAGAISDPASCPPATHVETLASLDATAGRLVVDANAVFVDTNRGVFRVPKCGGLPSLLSQNDPGEYAATGIAEIDSDVFITAEAPVRGGVVRRVGKSGGHEDLVSSSNALFGLARKGPRLVWVEKTASSGRVFTMAVGDGSAASLIDVPIAYAYGPIIADDLGIVFYAELGNNHGNLYDARDGAGSVAVGVAQRPVELIEGLGPLDLYFTFGHTGNNGIAHVTRGEDATHQDLVAHGRAPYGLARRGAVLYWSDAAQGTIQRCDLSPSNPRICENQRLIAAGENDPRFVAIDDGAVYWATNSGVLKRAPL